MLTEKKTVFELIENDGNTTDRHLHIEMFYLRESYKERGLENLSWIKGGYNPSDELTKEVRGNKEKIPLLSMMLHK